jgi:hypothetical protein
MNVNILQKCRKCVHNSRNHFWHLLLIWAGFVCDLLAFGSTQWEELMQGACPPPAEPAKQFTAGPQIISLYKPINKIRFHIISHCASCTYFIRDI